MTTPAANQPAPIQSPQLPPVAAAPPVREVVDKAEHDRVLAERDALQAKLKTQPTQAELDSKTAERVTLRVAAIRVDGKDGAITKLALDSTKTDRDVMLAVISAKDPSFKADGKSDDYVRARFDIAIQDGAAVRTDADPAHVAERQTIAALAGGEGVRTDADDGNAIERARQNMLKRQAEMAAGGKGN
jgi:hypothetical protein